MKKAIIFLLFSLCAFTMDAQTLVKLKQIENIDSITTFTGTLEQARALTNRRYKTIHTTNYGTGVFVRNDTVTVDNGGTQFINASGQGFSRVYDGEYISSKWFENTVDGLQKAANAARDFNVKLLIEGTYRISKPLNIYTSVEAKYSKLISTNSAGQINLLNTLPEIQVTPSTVTGLVSGSYNTNLSGYEGATLVLRSSAEVLMPRYGGSDYMKRQTFKIIDGNGALSEPLYMTFNVPDSMTVRVIPFEGYRTINDLHVQVDTMQSAYSVIINRMSNVTFNNLYLRNNDSMAYGSVGFASNAAANLTFNNPNIRL